MQLKSGNSYTLSQEVLSEVSHFRHRLCSMNEILNVAGRTRIISVGDVTTANLHAAGLKPFLEVVDLKTKRGREGEFSSVMDSHHVKNPAGTLSHDLFMLVADLINKGGRIEVDGEEDLAVIPIIYYSDLNTLVVYGIPDTGMACIAVDTEIKSKINELVKRIGDAGTKN